jgi:hypothetical protein
MACSTPSDCPGSSDCQTASCVAGKCGLLAVKDGTACTGLGHVCQSGACVACPGTVCGMACVDTTSVYWVNDDVGGTVWRIAK